MRCRQGWGNVVEETLAAALVAHSPSVILVVDQAGVIARANLTAQQLFGPNLEGQPWLALLDEFSRDKCQAMLEQTWATGSATDWELDHLQPTGEPVLISYSACLITTPTGTRLAAFGRDQSAKLELTSRLAVANQQLEGALLALEKAHAALKETQAQLVHSEKMRALGQMVAGVAHEINNPIAFVSNNLAYLDTLLPGLRGLFAAYQPLVTLADPAQRAAITVAEEKVDLAYLWDDLASLVAESQDGARRVREIVLSLRNFARLDEADLKEADINDGLRSTLALIRPACKDQVEIVEAYGELPRYLCQPGQLNQVFLNLLTNAQQAIEGKGTIWVTSACQENRIVVTIRDTGKGMDAATLARLGEPFFTTKPVGAGTGLGLAVSRGIIDRHHGAMRFVSEPGQGTTVIIELPLPARPITHDQKRQP